MAIKDKFLSSFSTRLSFYIFLTVLSVFMLSFAVSYRSSYNHVYQEASSRVKSTLESTVLKIDNVLESVETAIYNTSWMVSDNLDNPDYMYDITRHIIESNPYIIGSAIAFEPSYFIEKGRQFSPYSFRQGEQIQSKQLGNDDYDYHYMDWYQIPKLLEKPYWSEPYYDDGGANTIMTTYSYPLYNENGELYAILTADISLEWFTEWINNTQAYKNSYNLMIGRGGTYLVHPDTDVIMNKTIFISNDALEDAEFKKVGYKMVKGESGFSEFERNGHRFYFCYTPITKTGWSVASACLHSEIFSSINNMRKAALLVVLFALLLLAVLCYYAIRKLTVPLKKFADSATDIAKGNFTSSLPEIDSNDELKTLRDSFEYMQESLVEYIKELKESTSTKERIESELRIAHAIQMSMVPKKFPPYPERDDMDLFAKLIPAREVGGDLYDFFIEDGNLYFIVGDVSGKGIPASLVMAVTCRVFRTVAKYLNDPAKIVSSVNNSLADSNDSNMFCTFFMGILNLKSGLMRYCNAGHNAPIIIKHNGQVEMMELIPNIPLGVFMNFPYQAQEMTIEPGTRVFLYSDGVTEAENCDKQFFTESRLMKSLEKCHGKAPYEVVQSVLDDLAQHVNGAGQSDDIIAMCLKYDSSKMESMCKTLVMKNEVAEIARLAAFVNEICDDLNLGPEFKFNLNLALEEAVTNVILYAYPSGETHDIILTAKVEDNKLIFKLTDSGVEFDPTKAADADITLSVEERPIGGLGIFLMRKIMDEVKYQRIGDQNILILKKQIDKEPILK